MNKNKLPLKRGLIPASLKSSAKARTTFSDAFNQDAVAHLHSGVQSGTDINRRGFPHAVMNQKRRD